MDRTYWHQQTTSKPLYPQLLWSKPENRQLAGKLLIVGGNLYGFSAPAEAYKEAQVVGVGTARVLLPSALQKTIGRVFTAGEFAPSTPSGSFSKSALAELISSGNWSDGVLLAGDLGRNSETAILLEKFAVNFKGHMTVTKDAADYFINTPSSILSRPNTLLVISLAQLQKLALASRTIKPFTFDMDLLRVVEGLHEFTSKSEVQIVVKHLSNIFVAVNGQISTTKLDKDMDIWRVRAASYACVWMLQNPNQPFEALTTAMYDLTK